MTSMLGEKINKLRLEKGYSLEQLAKKTSTSKSYIWELENRPQRKPSAVKLASIALELSVTTEYLMDNTADMNHKVTEKAFFRKFKSLNEDDQQRIEDMVNLWGENK